MVFPTRNKIPLFLKTEYPGPHWGEGGGLKGSTPSRHFVQSTTLLGTQFAYVSKLQRPSPFFGDEIVHSVKINLSNPPLSKSP